MRNTAALRKPYEQQEADPSLGKQADAFANDLTELSRKYGIGITGEPVLFVMEPEDRNLAYDVDQESRLSFKTT